MIPHHTLSESVADIKKQIKRVARETNQLVNTRAALETIKGFLTGEQREWGYWVLLAALASEAGNEKVADHLSGKLGGWKPEDVETTIDMLREISDLLHSVPSGLMRFDFSGRTPEEVKEAAQQIIERFLDDRNDVVDHDSDYYDGELEKVLDFGNGWAWYRIDKEECDVEARAMGHCGNSASPRHGDRLYSLRKNLGGNLWRPSVTALLDSDGNVQELKGRGNKKPHPKYHDMIVDFLWLPEVKSFGEGRYDPSRDFSISDLSKEAISRFMKDKPEMILSPRIKSMIMDDEMMRWYVNNNEVDFIEDSDGDITFFFIIPANKLISKMIECVKRMDPREIDKELPEYMKISGYKLSDWPKLVEDVLDWEKLEMEHDLTRESLFSNSIHRLLDHYLPEGIVLVNIDDYNQSALYTVENGLFSDHLFFATDWKLEDKIRDEIFDEILEIAKEDPDVIGGDIRELATEILYRIIGGYETRLYKIIENIDLSRPCWEILDPKDINKVKEIVLYHLE